MERVIGHKKVKTVIKTDNPCLAAQIVPAPGPRLAGVGQSPLACQIPPILLG
jgi:hypothetical protein